MKNKVWKRNLIVLLAVCMCATFAFALSACDKGNNSNNQNQTPAEVLPTTAEIVQARAAVKNDTTQNYDFKLNLKGTVNIASFNGEANANYDGKYRYNSNTGDYKFRRQTSGVLLYDSIEYIYNSGTAKVKLVANENGTVKKTSVVSQSDEDLSLVNKPFVAIVDGLTAQNLSNIQSLKNQAYKYKAKMSLSSDNESVKKALSTVANMGTSLEMGDVSFTNIANGVDLYFNLTNGRLSDFYMSIDLSFPVKGTPLAIKLTYSQEENNTQISIPSTAGIISERAAITQEMNKITSAINRLKNSGAYSLDFEAKNEFDPGWNVRATVDKYIARMYKNTNNGRVDFNHSYKYKAHSEEDGKENYTYTVANIQDGTVHCVSRKGTNSITELNGVSANTQFDYLMNAAIISAENIDCIKKESASGTTKYYIYMNNAATLSVQQNIADIINSNDADGVLDVDNHFNSQKYMVRNAEMVIEMKGDELVGIEIATKLRYNPTSGEYTEENITLTNSIVLNVNKKLSNAEDYEAPAKTNSGLSGLGLNNAKYYIL